jgi:hypothetical protein
MSSDKTTEIVDTEVKMVPENIALVPRGEQIINFKLLGVDWQIKIKVLTNQEVDEFQKQFLDLHGEDIDSAGLSEERISKGLLEINTTFGGHKWGSLSEYARKKAVGEMHPRLRDRIGEEVFGQAHLKKQDADF